MAEEATELSPGSDTGADAGTTVDTGASASADAAPASTDANTAHSSGADKQDAKTEAKPTLFDAIKSAVEVKPSDGAPSDPDGSKTQEAKTDAPVDAAAEDEADKKLPFHSHPRWQKMQSDKKALTEEVAALKPAAEQYRMVDTFMAKTGLTSEDVVEGFKIMALIRQDPVKAVDAMTKIIIDLRTATGDIIPLDLKQKVDSGEMSEEAARELSTTRAQKKALETKQQQTQTATETENARKAAEVSGQQIESAANEWERKAKLVDPDFATKQPLIKDRIVVLMGQIGKPANPEAATALCERAYKDVTENLRTIRGPRMATPPAPRSGMSAATNAKAAPKTLKEALARAVS